jgi:hypothetical protein
VLTRTAESTGITSGRRPDQNRARGRSRLLLRPSRRLLTFSSIDELASGVGTAAHLGDAGVSAARTQPLMQSFPEQSCRLGQRPLPQSHLERVRRFLGFRAVEGHSRFAWTGRRKTRWSCAG